MFFPDNLGARKAPSASEGPGWDLKAWPCQVSSVPDRSQEHQQRGDILALQVTVRGRIFILSLTVRGV
jgi:hypothetical protein